MLLTVSSVLTADQLNDIAALAPSLSWADGRRTAGATAGAVKLANRPTCPVGPAPSYACVSSKPSVHTRCARAARPHRFSHLLLSRTQKAVATVRTSTIR